ncbi:hypothetical protein ABIA30_004743 [Mycobacterium sp. MAA66]|uniref:hypothetical protein n=1 Tax=Mycobacterium sp. MAA66 TaxID=3156297 RepID=UPI00351710CF
MSWWVGVPRDLIIGFVSGTSASVTFWLAMFSLKPKISISWQIARHTTTQNQVQYRIKIVNETWRPAEDVEVKAFLRVEKALPGAGGGILHQLVRIPIVESSGYTLGGYRRSDRDVRYARRILITDFDLDGHWTSDAKVLVRVSARDSISGFRKETERIYTNALTEIRDGYFAFGKNLQIS